MESVGLFAIHFLSACADRAPQSPSLSGEIRCKFIV